MRTSSLVLLFSLIASACCNCPTRESAATTINRDAVGMPLGIAELPPHSDVATSPASIEFVLQSAAVLPLHLVDENITARSRAPGGSQVPTFTYSTPTSSEAAACASLPISSTAAEHDHDRVRAAWMKYCDADRSTATMTGEDWAIIERSAMPDAIREIWDERCIVPK